MSNMTIYYEKGTYVCRVVAQGFDVSKEKKTPYFFMETEPRGAVNPNDPEGSLFACESHHRTVKMYLTDKTVDRHIEQLRLLGWNGTSFKDLEPTSEKGYSFVGTDLMLECQHDGDFENWDFPYEGSSSVAESNPEVSKALDNMFGKALQAAMPVSTPAEQPAAKTAPPPVEPAREPVAAAAEPIDDAGGIPF